MERLEKMGVDELGDWLLDQGFTVEVVEAFAGKSVQDNVEYKLIILYKLVFCCIFLDQEMDGAAVVQSFGTCSGPDCLKDVIVKFGVRVKVYTVIKGYLDKDNVKSLVSSNMSIILVSLGGVLNYHDVRGRGASASTIRIES